MMQFQVFRLKRTNINLEWCWSLLASVEHFDACGPQLRQLIGTNERSTPTGLVWDSTVATISYFRGLFPI